ncbi:MAG TPA: alpha,alpha-trehalose-phosphate synthase (UDP-forming) [Beijerinckiaceae bacterium]|jgi:trehalose 6-phosphate synthase
MAVAIPFLDHAPFGSAAGVGTGAGRLVLVSNRVPLPSNAGSPNAGGLAVALDAALKQRGGLWFGWSGNAVDGREPETQAHEFGNVAYAVSDLSRRDLDDFYHGFANRALWPVCHYRLDLTGFNRRNTAGYFRVNEFFAKRLAGLIRPDDVIWIHDYHFIPLASYLRRMGFSNRMGFFLHIPWAPPDLASVLPAYDLILRGFSAYDLVGFQTPQDTENFVNALLRDGKARALPDGCYEAYGRRFRVGTFPIGIDTAAFRRMAAAAERNALVRRTAASLAGKSLIIGVDRLDYSKGLPQRIEAFSCFLENNAAARNRVTLLQITPKSRSEVPEYAQMQRDLAEEIGRTNGHYGDVDWVPVRYVNKPIGHAALAGLYRLARVGLVTPLRDGMNLVAKEYVAAQGGEDPGVLVLSRFAGAAHELDGALLVNPYDTDATAAAIARALDMPLDERKERWTAMMARLDENTVDRWCGDFLESLRADETCAVEPAGDTDEDEAPSPGLPKKPVSVPLWGAIKN